MNRILITIALLMFLLNACSKPGDGNKTKNFAVLEPGTNLPVEGAGVQGYKCLQRDFFLQNCLSESYVTTVSTNSSGIASFSAAADIGVLKVSKTKYWSIQNQFDILSSSTTYLAPVATVKAHFTKQNSHPSNYQLFVVAQSGTCWDCNTISINLGQPLDTTVYLKGRGNFINNVNWYVSVGGSGIVMISSSSLINRFDTALVNIGY
ncbi:MAG: hypothetical protein SGI83_07295 [Bacteroidota bacterium]|nr:hypothetical protein [Bacteroidota bacterium]